MEYFTDAFGYFDPQGDPRVAAKFAINCLLMDERFNELACLLTDGHETGAIEGEPGWIIERRDTGASSDMPGYADWPAWANFRVYVDENSFDLAHPELYLSTQEFHGYVRKAIDAYLVRNSSRISMGNTIIEKLTR